LFRVIFLTVIEVISKLPRYHFGQITDKTLESLLNGISVVITGIPGFGKSYFPRFIQLILNQEYPKIKTVLINLELLSKNADIYRDQIKSRLECPPYADIQSYIEHLTKENQLVIILEGVSANIDKNLLQYCYSIGGINPNSVVFLTIANYSILNLDYAKDYKTYALFTKTLIVQPFDREGTERIILINNKQYNWNIPLRLIQEIHELSGGNPALILYICFYLTEYDTDSLNFIDHMLQYPPLLARVNDIAKVVIKEPLEICRRLQIFNDKGEIFSKLVSHYLKKFDAKGYGFFMKDLSDRERRILAILVENKNTLVEREKIAQLMKLTPDTYSLWAIYKAIQRLKTKIKNFYTVITVKNKGYILKEL